MTREIFGTEDPAHPGVATFNNQGRVLLSGPIEVLNYSYFQADFPETFRTAMEIREEIASRGWQRVVASKLGIQCTEHTKSYAAWRCRISMPMAF